MRELMIFVDFDGVLHPTPAGDKGLFCHLERFETCMRAYPKLQIVVSSSWREAFSWNEIRGFFSDDLQERLIDKTPVLPGSSRHQEILAWMNSRNYHGPWIALDDAAHEFPESCPQLCPCDTTIGFDENVERRLVAMIENLSCSPASG